MAKKPKSPATEEIPIAIHDLRLHSITTDEWGDYRIEVRDGANQKAYVTKSHHVDRHAWSTFRPDELSAVLEWIKW